MNKKIFYNGTINKNELKNIIHSAFEFYGVFKAVELVENVKKSGFNFATKAGISISIEDLKVPPTKDVLFLKNNKNIKQAYFYESRGNISEIERFQKVIDTWHNTSDLLKNQLVDFFKAFDPLNPVYMMAFSGARGNLSQVRQLVAMRGLMADPKGQIIDLPIKANFREGLSTTDFVISSYGARKGIVDTALRTADSGYLTRRLIDVAQHVIIRELDCKTKNGIRIRFDPNFKNLNRFNGRILINSLFDKKTGELLMEEGSLLTTAFLKRFTQPVDLILRSPLTCESSRSICQKCYGSNLATGKLIELADAVGIIAAQSIGEPGTQLTMRTFHTGGVFTGESNNQIRSQFVGRVLFASDLKTIIGRTIYGERILKATNNSRLFLVAQNNLLIKIPVLAGMLIFVKNKTVVQKGNLIAEVPQTNKQINKQIKMVNCAIDGEIQFQNIKCNKNSISVNDGLIWVASGDVYNIPSNMMVKKAGDTVVKSNSIAQSKIILSSGGFVKINQINSKIKLAFINNVLIFNRNLFYKKNKKIICRLNNKLLFRLDTEPEQELLPIKSFGKRLANNYYSSDDAKIIYPSNLDNDNKIVKSTICLTQNLIKSEKSKYFSLINPVSRGNIEYTFHKKIIFPGEFLFEKIEIQETSICEFVFTKDDFSKLVKVTPLKQWAITNPSRHTIKNCIYFFKPFSINFFTHFQVKDTNLIFPDQCFVKSHLGIGNLSQSASFKFIPKYASINRLKKDKNQLLIFSVRHFPSSFLNQNLFVSYTISNNQYIEPYSTIGTINNVAKKKTSIKVTKNNINNPSRFIFLTKTNYKTYLLNSEQKLSKPKFIVIGDPLNPDKTQFSDYSGFNTLFNSSSTCILRKSLPFFVSSGATILVQHSSLICKDEAMCQLIYTRIISNDIITGLPRIENLLEARNSDEKDNCELIKNPGVVKITNENGELVIIEKKKRRVYYIIESSTLPFRVGEIVSVAQPLNIGLINPHKVLDVYFKYFCSFYTPEYATIKSIANAQILLRNLIQDVYHSQGIFIADKHVEIIIRQITSKVRIISHNLETLFVLKEFLDFEQARYINFALKSTKKPLIEYEPVLVGITKVALMAESFVSAASFQETTRILTQAAIEGRIEWLRGLKENVILGRLIPAGTGFNSFNTTSVLNIRFKL